MIDENIRKLAKDLLDIYEHAYNLYKIDVDYIITNNVKDINYIERILDYVLSIYTEKGFNLFLLLLLYYKDVNYQNAKTYLEILKEERSEEYHDFIKKLKLNH